MTSFSSIGIEKRTQDVDNYVERVDNSVDMRKNSKVKLWIRYGKHKTGFRHNNGENVEETEWKPKVCKDSYPQAVEKLSKR